MVEDRLVAAARAAQLKAYAPYSKFHVGAALETADGAIFSGCNVENASYGGTICAERTAIVSAVAAGHQKFVRIAVTSDAPDPVAPCGLCRQFLAEFGTGLEVVSAGRNGATKRWTLGELLPDAFTGEDFQERRT